MKFLAVLAFLLALTSPALAAPPTCDKCKDLPRLERELFEQEWLQREFHEYARYGKALPAGGAPGDSADAMVRQVTSDFNAWLKSPAGGGGGRDGAAELGTDWKDCKLVMYVDRGKKTVPFDEKKYREKNCAPLADYLLAHENKHVEQCKAHKGADLSYYANYAAFDTEAYGTGIRNLRASIAALAKKCGWEGSTRPTKKNPEDGKDEDVVPTLKRANELAKRVVKK